MATKAKQSKRPRKESPDATELLVLELQEIHNAESQLTRVGPRLSKAIDSDKADQNDVQPCLSVARRGTR